MKLKIAVYSCITGGYEPFRHNQATVGADFFMFSDKYERSKVWHFIEATKLFKDPRRNARYHKILAHEFFPNYDVWFWIDGSMEIKASPLYLVKEWMPYNDITLFRHPDRDCVYDEAVVCRGKQYDYPKVIDKQMMKYRRAGYPRKNGLSETKILIRYNTPKVVQFNKAWHYELMTGSLRDQLSFDYVAWKHKMRVNRVAPMQKGQKAFFYHKHEEKREETKYN
jgi:hypothetical protein